jgi:hypothetical protein
MGIHEVDTTNVNCLTREAGHTCYLPTLGSTSFHEKSGTAGSDRIPNLIDEHPNNLFGRKCMREGSRQALERTDSLGECLRGFTTCRLRNQRLITVLLAAFEINHIVKLCGGNIAMHE